VKHSVGKGNGLNVFINIGLGMPLEVLANSNFMITHVCKGSFSFLLQNALIPIEIKWAMA
jgi:hypothetical protein